MNHKSMQKAAGAQHAAHGTECTNSMFSVFARSPSFRRGRRSDEAISHEHRAGEWHSTDLRVTAPVPFVGARADRSADQKSALSGKDELAYNCPLSRMQRAEIRPRREVTTIEHK